MQVLVDEEPTGQAQVTVFLMQVDEEEFEQLTVKMTDLAVEFELLKTEMTDLAGLVVKMAEVVVEMADCGGRDGGGGEGDRDGEGVGSLTAGVDFRCWSQD